MSDANTVTKSRRRIATADLANSKLDVYGAPDASGKQAVSFSFPIDPAKWQDAKRQQAAIYGFIQFAANTYNRLDDPSPENVRAVLDKLDAALTDGTFEPGRNLAQGEPTLLERALAEATGVPVADMQRDIAERLVLGPDGTPVTDARGRNKRVFTKAVLDAMARDPNVQPILARLTREEAVRLDREAKAHKGDAPTGALDLFKRPAATPQAEAAQ
jgi:hypothetical protein